MTSKETRPVIEQPDTAIPLMLAQAIVVGGVLAIGELACSPLYCTLMDHSVALVPWALEAVFLAVAFTYVVGFALLKEKFRPFGYAAVGLIGYGVWSLLVFTATINSILTKVGESALTNGQVGAIALNGAALGFVAFLVCKMLDVKLGNRKGLAVMLLVVQIVLAIIGLLIMIRMFSVLYAA